MIECFECKKPATREFLVVPGGTMTLPLCEECYVYAVEGEELRARGTLLEIDDEQD